MRLGVFAKTFPGSDPLTVLGAARASGYACVQYNMACSGLPALPDMLTDADCAAVLAASAATGIAISALSGTANMIHPDPVLRRAGVDRVAVLIARARDMGTGMVTLCTGTRDAGDPWRHHPDNGSAGAWADLLDGMGLLCALAERHGILLGIEPEPGNVVRDAAAARRLIDTLQSPALAVVLDPANLIEGVAHDRHARTIAGAVDLLADRIGLAHAKDRDAGGAVVAAGRGVVDFARFIACLRGAGFAGDLVTHGLDASEAPGVAAFLAETLAAP